MHFAPETHFPNPTQGLFVPRSLRSTSIEDMLNNPGLKHEDLFDDENFLFELKHGNPRLMDYLSKNMTFVKLLVEYITITPPDLNNNKRACQYPQLANDIFESDLPIIMNAFFSADFSGEGSAGLRQDELLTSLFSFVKTKGELNSVLAGYFNKLVLKLYKKNNKKLIQFFYADKEILNGFVEHLEEHSLLESLAVFFCYEGYLFDDKNPEILDAKMRALDRIFLNYNEASAIEQMAHIGEFLKEIIHRNEAMADTEEIMGRVYSKQTIMNLFGVLANAKSNQVIVQICNAIIVLLGYHEKKQSISANLNMFASQYFSREFDNDPFLNSISDNLSILVKILMEEKPGVGIPTAYGQNTKTVGVAKLKVIELIEKLVKIGNPTCCVRMSEVGLIKILTGMFSKFVWNNLLHISYDRLVMMILEKKNQNMLEDLFEKAELLQLIVREIREDQFELPKSGKKIRKGNLGFIIKISNDLNKVAAKDAKVDGYLRKCLEWDSIVTPALKQRNEMNEKQIGGTHPLEVHKQIFGYAYGESNGDCSPKAGSYLDPQPENQKPLLSFTAASEEVTFRGNSFEPIVEKVGTNSSSNLPDFMNSPTPMKFMITEDTKDPVKVQAPSSFTDFYAMSELRNSIDDILAKAQKTLAKAENRERSAPQDMKYTTSEPIEEKRDGFRTIERESITFNLPSVEVERKTENPPMVMNMSNDYGLKPNGGSYLKSDEGYNSLYQDKPIKNEYAQDKQPLKTWVLPLGLKRDMSAPEFGMETRSLGDRSFDSDDTPNSIPKINSMHDLKNNTKINSKINKTPTFDGRRILDMIDKIKTPDSNIRIDFSYSENCKAESDIMFEDSEPVIVNRILDSTVLLGTKSFKGR